jgi:hypothetical protein
MLKSPDGASNIKYLNGLRLPKLVDPVRRQKEGPPFWLPCGRRRRAGECDIIFK